MVDVHKMMSWERAEIVQHSKTKISKKDLKATYSVQKYLIFYTGIWN